MAQTQKKEPPYFLYFPGNYRWSAAILSMLASAAWGGSDIAEVHKIGRLLKDARAEDDDAWFDACVGVADEVAAHAKRYDDAESATQRRLSTCARASTTRWANASAHRRT